MPARRLEIRTAELEIVDTLIAAGVANNRAEAIRWALTRIREHPAYEQLREHTRDIERLKIDF
jgi:Arc/MetJ-type ribon-helix-helix transcriptional regulator